MPPCQHLNRSPFCHFCHLLLLSTCNPEMSDWLGSQICPHFPTSTCWPLWRPCAAPQPCPTPQTPASWLPPGATPTPSPPGLLIPGCSETLCPLRTHQDSFQLLLPSLSVLLVSAANFVSQQGQDLIYFYFSHWLLYNEHSNQLKHTYITAPSLSPLAFLLFSLPITSNFTLKTSVSF